MRRNIADGICEIDCCNDGRRVSHAPTDTLGLGERPAVEVKQAAGTSSG